MLAQGSTVTFQKDYGKDNRKSTVQKLENGGEMHDCKYLSNGAQVNFGYIGLATYMPPIGHTKTLLDY